MHLSGQTPLFRAKKLEKYLGVETVYLKLEGTNPTGHKNDRIAESLVKYAISKGFSKVLIQGSERYLMSILYFANYLGVEAFAPVTKERYSKSKKQMNVSWLKIDNKKGQNEDELFEQYAIEHNMFFTSEWEKKPFIRNLAVQQMMQEALVKLEAPTAVWSQINGGYTIKSIYEELMRNWVNGSLESLPEIHCGIDEKLEQALIENTAHAAVGQPESRIESIQGALKTTQAKIHIVTNEELKETVKLIKTLENVTITANEAYSLAAFIKCENYVNGTHIIFLNDGKSDIKIQEISKEKNLDLENIVAETRKLLEPYNDSYEETIDAVNKAVKMGFIFKATRKDEIQGICIIVHMGFERFIPTYHLAYIGVLKGNSGRGVATELINQALEKTNGLLSLHVDIPNKSAKKLYEKMGFVHCYDRMLYKG